MEKHRKLIVGYDLCEDISQISCFSYKTLEPIPIGAKEGEEHCPIPTVLCVKKDTKLWLYGEEAVTCASSGEGIMVDQLLTKIRKGETVDIYQQKFSGVALLEKFLRRSLTLIKNYFPTEPITKIVITIHDMEPVVIDGIYEALAMLGIDKDRAVVISHAGAYLYYALSQDKTLWMNDVGLFDFSELGLLYYQISINRRSQPMVAVLTKKEFTDTLCFDMMKKKEINLGYAFENLANTALYKQIISTIYFTGKGFEGGWAEEALKRLCVGRRIFFGQNLYTKGACYAAKELSGDQKLEDYILLNDEMIINSISVRAYSDAKIKEIPLSEAGVPWYEVNKSIEVIPDDETEFNIILKNLLTREMITKRIVLENLPDRPNRMTRLAIKLSCISKTIAKITVMDLGFGDIYTQTGMLFEFTFEI